MTVIAFSILQNNAFRNVMNNLVEGSMTATFLKWKS